MTDLKTHLATRRSPAIPLLRAPAPEGAELDAIIEHGVRVPDHGKLAPWRLVLIRDAGAARLGRELAELAQRREDAPLSETRRIFEETRFVRAPLVIMVVSTAAPHFKIPEWEQVLSAGALALNLMHAVHAFGYAANWLTEWPAYDEEAKPILGLGPSERVVAFLYVGTQDGTMSERPRPKLSDFVSEAPGDAV